MNCWYIGHQRKKNCNYYPIENIYLSSKSTGYLDYAYRNGSTSNLDANLEDMFKSIWQSK
jgi:hypothetical protein